MAFEFWSKLTQILIKSKAMSFMIQFGVKLKYLCKNSKKRLKIKLNRYFNWDTEQYCDITCIKIEAYIAYATTINMWYPEILKILIVAANIFMDKFAWFYSIFLFVQRDRNRLALHVDSAIFFYFLVPIE